VDKLGGRDMVCGGRRVGPLRAGLGPQARVHPLKIFTPNKKTSSQLQSEVGLG
jgi:hypothetical protein